MPGEAVNALHASNDVVATASLNFSSPATNFAAVSLSMQFYLSIVKAVSKQAVNGKQEQERDV